MSLSYYCFVGNSPETVEEWQSKLVELQLPVRIEAAGEVNALRGITDVKVGEIPVEIEIYCNSAARTVPILEEKLGGRQRCISFYWSSDENSFSAACFAFAALVRGFDGWVWDPILTSFVEYEELLSLANGGPALERPDYHRMQVVKYDLIKNHEGLYENCQRCKWNFPSPRENALCAECGARCPVCDSYLKNCANVGVFQLGLDRDYWRWVKEQHEQVGETDFWWSDSV